jgi:NAD-dependent deacetylase
VHKPRVFVITGAGVSAESGIPTFRGKDGYWRSFDPTKLATPEAFEKDPKLVWEWYRERRQCISAAKPNAAHDAIVKLAEHAREFLLLTQNVDDLHTRAGLPPQKMVQIHGDIFVTRCSRCDFSDVGRGGSSKPPAAPTGSLSSRRLRSIAPTLQSEVLSKCPQCGALMRPGVVWFGEQLDPRKIDIVEDFLSRGPCDLVIVIGTTALFGYIIDWATRAGGDLIEINPAETALSKFATRLIREPAAIALPRVVDELITSPDSLP